MGQNWVQRVLNAMKPIVCDICKCRLADIALLSSHKCQVMNLERIDPRNLTVQELKMKLQQLGESVTGSKEILCRRFEAAIS